MNNNVLTLPSASPRPLRSLFLLLLLGLVLALLGWTVSQEQPRQWRPAEPQTLALSDQYYSLPEQEVEKLGEQSLQYFSNGALQGRTLLSNALDQRVNSVFDEVRQRLPAFADWY